MKTNFTQFNVHKVDNSDNFLIITTPEGKYVVSKDSTLDTILYTLGVQ